METWTPKMQRAREKWRQRGNLAGIQITENLSLDELAEKFRLEAEAKTNQISPIEPLSNVKIIFNSADQVLKYLTPPKRIKK
jgi:hypothetical protein